MMQYTFDLESLKTVLDDIEQHFPKPVSSTPLIHWGDFHEILEEIEKNVENEKTEYPPEYWKAYLQTILAWIQVNPHHTFPKSAAAWKNVLKTQFNQFTYSANPHEILQIIDHNRKLYPSEKYLAPIVNQVYQYLEENPFYDTDLLLHHQRSKLDQMCKRIIHIPIETAFQKMVELGIVQQHSNSNSRKRSYCQVEKDLVHNAKKICLKT